jgi:hypothetical protein
MRILVDQSPFHHILLGKQRTKKQNVCQRRPKMAKTRPDRHTFRIRGDPWSVFESSARKFLSLSLISGNPAPRISVALLTRGNPVPTNFRHSRESGNGDDDGNGAGKCNGKGGGELDSRVRGNGGIAVPRPDTVGLDSRSSGE